MENIFENKKFAGFVTLIVIVVVLVSVFKDSKKNIEKSREAIKSYPLEVVNHNYYKNAINIDVDDVLVEFNNDNKDGVLVKVIARDGADYKVYENEDVLNIKMSKTNCEGTCLEKEKVIVSLPGDYAINLNINSEKGNVIANDLNINSSNIVLKEGSLSIKTLKIDGDSIINITKGDIKIEELKDINIVAEINEGKNNIRGNNTNSNIKLDIAVDKGNVLIN